jgi:hypothetical protein
MTELSLHILDIVQNSISAKATAVSIVISESITGNSYKIEITDNGKGMDEETVAKALDPFYTTRTTRSVGLGLPLFKQAVELCEGKFLIESLPGKGTSIKASMLGNHIDRQPLGDIAGVLVQLISSYSSIHFLYKHETDYGKYEFDTNTIIGTLDGIPINDVNVIRFLRQMIQENLDEIRIGR